MEVCYQAWLDSPRHVQYMKRVLGVQCNPADAIPISVEEIESKELFSKQTIVSPALIKHWIFSGPGGKIYEIENITVLEIPNHFYCTTSTDPNDISVQSSLLFTPDERTQNTLLEWQISLWGPQEKEKGKFAQLISDIWETGDTLLDDCLQDFKRSLEEE